MFTPAEMYRELDELRTLLESRIEQGPTECHVSTDADYLPSLRVRIDSKIAALGTSQEDESLGDEEFLGFIADLIEYRVALFNTPIAYYPVDSDEAGPPGEVPPLQIGTPTFVIKHQGTKDNQ